MEGECTLPLPPTGHSLEPPQQRLGPLDSHPVSPSQSLCCAGLRDQETFYWGSSQGTESIKAIYPLKQQQARGNL